MNDRPDANFDLDELLHPATAFERPSEVVNDPDLTLNEKRAILASWASDACAVEAAPELRSSPSGTPVRFDDIMEALRSLDKQANGARYRPHRTPQPHLPASSRIRPGRFRRFAAIAETSNVVADRSDRVARPVRCRVGGPDAGQYRARVLDLGSAMRQRRRCYILSRHNNVVTVDFRPETDPPAPRFPGAGAVREPSPERCIEQHSFPRGKRQAC